MVVLAMLACRSKPIPLVAREGSSITVVLTGEYGAAEPGGPPIDVGFGGTFYWEQDFRDVQRGEVQFLLGLGGTEVELNTQLVTRILPDPASDIGIANHASIYPFNDLGMGQVLAVVHIPKGIKATLDLPGRYWLRARKILRAEAGGSYDVLADLPYGEWIDVLPAADDPEDPDSPNPPYVALWGTMSMEGPGIPQQLYPHPKLLVWFPASPPVPSAAHLKITVPDDIRVLSVFEEQHYGRRSLVSWTEADDEVEIHFVNSEPSPSVGHLAIAFKPVDPATYVRFDGTNRSIGDDFLVSEAEFWNIDGELLAAVGPADVVLGPIR